MTAPPSFSRRLAATLSLVAAMVLTGANVAIGKAIVAEVPVYVFMLFRFLVSVVALAPLAAREAGPRLGAMSRTERRDLLFMALLGMVGFTVLMLEGLKRTSAADAGIITATLPAVVALLGILLMRDRLTWPQAGAVALAIAGLLLVQATGAQRGASTLLGNLLVMGAVLGEASFVILGKRLAPPYRPLRLALGANMAGLVFAMPLALLDAPAFDIGTISRPIWGLGTWYALSASVFCLWLWYRGLPYVETWLAGLATAALPVAALAGSALFLGETIGGWKLSGAGLVLAGIVLGALARPRDPPR
jgi:drug/metabolite transporter (DMT)-like permease